MIVCRPIVHKDSYTQRMERLVWACFEETIYTPIRDLITQNRENAKQGALLAAIAAGAIVYRDGVFLGKFTALTSKEMIEAGATWSQHDRGFYLPIIRAPLAIRQAVQQAGDRSKRTHEELLILLLAMEPNFEQATFGIAKSIEPAGVLADLDDQFTATVGKNQPTVEGIHDELTKDLEERISRPIGDCGSKTIKEIRQAVSNNAARGGSIQELTELIEAKAGVTKRHAVFIADQETAVLISKYRRRRYLAAGHRTYRWKTCRDDLVRPDHHALEDTVHSWDSPPITCRATGDRNHPGQDFRCRCDAEPIIEFQG